MTKSTTIQIINDKEGTNLAAFKEACEFSSVEYRLVSSLSESLLEISVKHSIDSQLFLLGAVYSARKMAIKAE